MGVPVRLLPDRFDRWACRPHQPLEWVLDEIITERKGENRGKLCFPVSTPYLLRFEQAASHSCGHIWRYFHHHSSTAMNTLAL